MTILVAEMSSKDNLLQFLGVSILFIFILVITYFTTKFIGGYKMGVDKNSNFKVLETHKITQNKYLQLVQIGKRFFIIAIGKDEIRLISELNEEDIHLKDPFKIQKGNFTDIFSSVVNKQKDKNKQVDQVIQNGQADQVIQNDQADQDKNNDL
jgi:flagellar protein FliO/FliZ